MWTGAPLLAWQAKADCVKGLSLLLNVEARGVPGEGGAQPSGSPLCAPGPGQAEALGDLRQVGHLRGTPEVPGALRILGVQPGLNQHKCKSPLAWETINESGLFILPLQYFLCT